MMSMYCDQVAFMRASDQTVGEMNQEQFNKVEAFFDSLGGVDVV